MINKIQIGKLFTLIIILIFAAVGLVLLFMDAPKERMEAFTMLVQAMFPYLAIPSTGVAITGIIKRIIKEKDSVDENKT